MWLQLAGQNIPGALKDLPGSSEHIRKYHWRSDSSGAERLRNLELQMLVQRYLGRYKTSALSAMPDRDAKLGSSGRATTKYEVPHYWQEERTEEFDSLNLGMFSAPAHSRAIARGYGAIYRQIIRGRPRKTKGLRECTTYLHRLSSIVSPYSSKSDCLQ